VALLKICEQVGLIIVLDFALKFSVRWSAVIISQHNGTFRVEILSKDKQNSGMFSDILRYLLTCTI